MGKDAGVSLLAISLGVSVSSVESGGTTSFDQISNEMRGTMQKSNS